MAKPTKTDVLRDRLSESEKEAFQTAADIAGISVSSWVRERLRMAAVRDLEGAGMRVPFIKPIALRGRQ